MALKGCLSGSNKLCICAGRGCGGALQQAKERELRPEVCNAFCISAFVCVRVSACGCVCASSMQLSTFKPTFVAVACKVKFRQRFY